MNIVTSSLQDRKDIDDLEKIFYSSFVKLNSTELKLKETQLQLQEVTLAKLELQRILESKRRELSNMKAQYEMKQQWEQENFIGNNFGETTAAQKIELESLSNEKNALSESIKKLQLENMNLKLEIEDKEKQLKQQRSLENSIEMSKSSINSTFENIFEQNRLLVAEQDSLQKMVEMSKNTGEYMLQLLKQHHKVLNETFAENYNLKNAQTLLSSELNLIKRANCELQMKCSGRDNNEKKLEIQMRKYAAMVKLLLNKIDAESEEKKNLNKLLKRTLDEKITSIETEQNLRTRIKELENIISYNNNKMNSEIVGSSVHASTQTY